MTGRCSSAKYPASNAGKGDKVSELVTLRKIEQSKLAISEVKNLDEIKTLIDQGEALKAYARSAQLSAEIQAEALVECGSRSLAR